ncbi:MAG: hypothetical protein IT249_04965 [Chitinophagaceae bacterium]|nr:hypothetical protein [Chitinophagaceae bacterium]
MKYDDASWHYGGDFPESLSNENGATHIGMFLTWMIDNDFLSEEQEEECRESIKLVKSRILSGSEFLIKELDEVLTDEDLNEIGNLFSADYYDEKSQFSTLKGNYLLDYQKVFTAAYPNDPNIQNSIYFVEDTWANYEIIKQTIDHRFIEWTELGQSN